MKNNTLILICSIIVTGILGISLISSTAIIGETLKTIKMDNTISVTGSAKTTVRADLAMWNATLSSSGLDRQSAYKKLTEDREVVNQFLLDTGLKQNEIGVSSVQSNVTYERDSYYNSTGRVISYDFSLSFTVRSNDVVKVSEVSRSVTDLIGTHNITIYSGSPEFVCTDLAAKKIEVIRLATKDSMERARSIVESTNKKLGVILSAKTGVFQITPVGSTLVDDYGINDNSSIDKEISATVKSTFKIN